MLVKKILILVSIWSLSFIFGRLGSQFSFSSIHAGSDINIYVSDANGNDGNSGTLELPFRTLTKAQQHVRGLINSAPMQSNINVLIKGGRYQLTETLTFGPTDSGNNGFWVTWKAYDWEPVVISGGTQVSNWTQTGNYWRAQVGSGKTTRDLYVNNKPAQRARWMNNGSITAVIQDYVENGVSKKRLVRYNYTGIPISSWPRNNEIEIVAQNTWREFRCRITNITASTFALIEECRANSDDNSDPFDIAWSGLKPPAYKNPVWIENSLSVLDEPGEWYLDSAGGLLYYYPRPGESINSTIAVIPNLEKLLVLGGEDNSRIHNIRFQNLIFADTTWLKPNENIGFFTTAAGFQWLPTSRLKPAGSIVIRKGSDIEFSDNTFINLGASAIVAERGQKRLRVESNIIKNIAAGGIYLSDADNAKTTDLNDIPEDNIIKNNLITKTGLSYHNMVGIWLGYSRRSNIFNNEIFDLPYTGITIHGSGNDDDSISADNKVFYNHTHDIMKILLDGGGIYSLAHHPGNEYAYNFLTKQNNEYGALYLDDKSRGIYVHHNVIFDNYRTALIKGGGHTITNNYWQNRGTIDNRDDIWFMPQSTCPDGKCCMKDGVLIVCPPNSVSDNTVISSLSQAPAQIIDQAGPDNAALSIFAPVRFLTPQATVVPGSWKISWAPVAAAYGYLIRVDDKSNPWSCGTINPGDVCTSVLNNEYTHNFELNHTYNIWVHAYFDDEKKVYSNPINITVSVNSFVPTPTGSDQLSLAGDLNSDQAVNYADLNLFQTMFETGDNQADFNGNGTVDVYDLSILLGNYGESR